MHSLICACLLSPGVLQFREVSLPKGNQGIIGPLRDYAFMTIIPGVNSTDMFFYGANGDVVQKSAAGILRVAGVSPSGQAVLESSPPYRTFPDTDYALIGGRASLTLKRNVAVFAEGRNWWTRDGDSASINTGIPWLPGSTVALDEGARQLIAYDGRSDFIILYNLRSKRSEKIAPKMDGHSLIRARGGADVKINICANYLFILSEVKPMAEPGTAFTESSEDFPTSVTLWLYALNLSNKKCSCISRLSYPSLSRASATALGLSLYSAGPSIVCAPRNAIYVRGRNKVFVMAWNLN